MKDDDLCGVTDVEAQASAEEIRRTCGSMNIHELRALAKMLGIRHVSRQTKQQLCEFVTNKFCE